tara:strand:+ start:191 stop:454 length:264 start_codon:yes stop_codon:yes gene_type:complete
MKLTYHTDPSHGWLHISNYDLMRLGLNAKALSTYSYRDNSGVYAEEDCDAAIILAAADDHNVAVTRGSIENIHVDKPHWIRDLRRCG